MFLKTDKSKSANRFLVAFLARHKCFSMAFRRSSSLIMVYAISQYTTAADVHDIRYSLGRYVECFVNPPLSLRYARVKDNSAVSMGIKALIKEFCKEKNRCRSDMNSVKYLL